MTKEERKRFEAEKAETLRIEMEKERLVVTMSFKLVRYHSTYCFEYIYLGNGNWKKIVRKN